MKHDVQKMNVTSEIYVLCHIKMKHILFEKKTCFEKKKKRIGHELEPLDNRQSFLKGEKKQTIKQMIEDDGLEFQMHSFGHVTSIAVLLSL